MKALDIKLLLIEAHTHQVQGWSVDPMEDVILTHRVLAARSTVRLSESLALCKSFSLVLWSLVVMVTAQASVVILWQRVRPKEVEKYDLLVEKNRVATRRKAGRRWRERKSQVDCSGACANLTWKNVRA